MKTQSLVSKCSVSCGFTSRSFNSRNTLRYMACRLIRTIFVANGDKASVKHPVVGIQPQCRQRKSTNCGNIRGRQYIGHIFQAVIGSKWYQSKCRLHIRIWHYRPVLHHLATTQAYSATDRQSDRNSPASHRRPNHFHHQKFTTKKVFRGLHPTNHSVLLPKAKLTT